MRAAAEKRVVLLGETHDIAEIHRWQLHVTAFLHMLRPQMAVGFEMFPLRVQPVLPPDEALPIFEPTLAGQVAHAGDGLRREAVHGAGDEGALVLVPDQE